MRKTLNISASVLLCLWYLLSTAGFDIHSDRHDHRTYVVSLITGISCEHIHPDDECSCCHHHLGGENCEEEDCTNEVHILSITGDGQTHSQLLCEVPSSFAIITIPKMSLSEDCIHSTDGKSPQKETPPKLRLRLLCTMRA